MSGQASKALVISATRRHLAAQGRRRAVLCRQPVLRLRLHRLDCLHLLHPLGHPAALRMGGFRAICAAVEHARVWYVALENLIFGGLFHDRLPRHRHLSWRSCSTSAFRAEGAPRDHLICTPMVALPFIVYRPALEVDPQFPRSALERVMIDSASPMLSSSTARQPRDGHLHRWLIAGVPGVPRAMSWPLFPGPACARSDDEIVPRPAAIRNGAGPFRTLCRHHPVRC